MQLKEMTHLSQIDLGCTGVTDAGVKELKLTLPNLTIVLFTSPNPDPHNLVRAPAVA